MALEFKTLSEMAAHGFDAVIDVRSPSEFAEDHLPGAINLPVLTDEERARVGTVYVQDSPFRARKIGAALVARNAARHIETVLVDKGGGWRPLVYCWRGGQRSGAFATILRQIGWRAETVAGGYRAYRRLVVRSLYDEPWPHRLVLLDGYTGSAKTEVLGRLAARGVQVLDLERLANHRGSILGWRAMGQPSQKAFETAIALGLAGFEPGHPVVVEAESSKIGQRIVPPRLWRAMQDAPRILIDAPAAARAYYLSVVYRDVLKDVDAFSQSLAALNPYHGHAQVEAWQKLLGDGAHTRLAAELIERHYDPRYAKSRARAVGDVVARVTAERLDPPGIAALAREVEQALSRAP